MWVENRFQFTPKTKTLIYAEFGKIRLVAVWFHKLITFSRLFVCFDRAWGRFNWEYAV